MLNFELTVKFYMESNNNQKNCSINIGLIIYQNFSGNLTNLWKTILIIEIAAWQLELTINLFSYTFYNGICYFVRFYRVGDHLLEQKETIVIHRCEFIN